MFLRLSLCLCLGRLIGVDSLSVTFTTGTIMIVNEGDTVRLPCYVDKLDGSVLLWKRNHIIITVSNQILDTNFRLDVTSNGNTLVIGPVSPSDEAVSFED